MTGKEAFNMSGKLNLDSQAIYDKVFSIDFKGYNGDEVDRFLDLVIEDYQTFADQAAEAEQKISDLEHTNASLRAKVIELEAKLRVQDEADPISKGAGNVDILQRLSRLEQQVSQLSPNPADRNRK